MKANIMAKKSARSRSSNSNNTDLKEALRRFVRARGAEFLRDPNVTSIGVGRKNGDGEISLVFTVDVKAEASVLESLDTKELPETMDIEGFTVPTDVVQRSYKASLKLIEAEATDIHKTRVDPLVPGVSVSHVDGTAGTIGAIMFDSATGAPCILSNWHVLHGNTGKIGDAIVQPGPFDDNDIAGNGCGELLRSHLGAAGDCALARIRLRGFDREIQDLGVVPKRLAEVDIDDTVVKSGRTTKTTHGIVRRIDVMAKIDYGSPTGVVAVGGFEIGVDPKRLPANGEISMGGDSGSAWMITDGDKTTDIFAGLHYAGEGSGNPDEHALACYPRSVQKKLRFVLEPPANLVLDDDDVEAIGRRNGFDEKFLGINAPMPRMTLSIKRDAVNFGRAQTIPYTHFSVCLSAKRRLARFVAWNVDGAQKVVLGGHGFRLDNRISAAVQHDDSLYADNNLDRGHIARRADLAWGPVKEAKQANRDSFFFTNIAPQHERFNRSSSGGRWGKLENLILEQADTQDIRVSVIGGSIFRDDDPEYRSARIPREFWKLVAYRASDGALTSASFVLSQNNLLQDIETLDLDPFRLFQVSVDDLAERTKLGFSAYADADVFRNPERIVRGLTVAAEIVGERPAFREILDEEEIVF
jgi:endonuclease G